MTDATHSGAAAPATGLLATDARTRRRNAAEKRFRAYGLAAIGTGLFFLVVLLGSILYNGVGAFQQTFIKAEIFLTPEQLDPSGNRDPEEIAKVLTFSYSPIIKGSLTALAEDLQQTGAPDITPEMLAGMVSGAANAATSATDEAAAISSMPRGAVRTLSCSATAISVRAPKPGPR